MRWARLLLLLALAGCAKHIKVGPPRIESHDTFSVEVIKPDEFLVSTASTRGETDIKEYLCTRSHVCTWEVVPVHVYHITRVRK